MIPVRSLIPLATAARLLPPGQSGKPVHASTLRRWIEDGDRATGIKLEAAWTGSRWLTSEDAIKEYFARLTAAKHQARQPAAPTLRVAKAGAELDMGGW